MKFFLLFLFSLAFASCGKQPMPWDKQIVTVQSVKPAEAEMYSYALEGRNCATGEHSFHTLEEVCSALLDHQLNNECLEDERLDLHAKHCQG